MVGVLKFDPLSEILPTILDHLNCLKLLQLLLQLDVVLDEQIESCREIRLFSLISLITQVDELML